MPDPHQEARYVLRHAANDALKMADKIEATAAAVEELWGTAGLARMLATEVFTPVTPAGWAAEKRAYAAALLASADALRSP